MVNLEIMDVQRDKKAGEGAELESTLVITLWWLLCAPSSSQASSLSWLCSSLLNTLSSSHCLSALQCGMCEQFRDII